MTFQFRFVVSAFPWGFSLDPERAHDAHLHAILALRTGDRNVLEEALRALTVGSAEQLISLLNVQQNGRGQVEN